MSEVFEAVARKCKGIENLAGKCSTLLHFYEVVREERGDLRMFEFVNVTRTHYNFYSHFLHPICQKGVKSSPFSEMKKVQNMSGASKKRSQVGW